MTTQMLTVREVAEVLRESTVTTSRRCKRGEFPGAIKTGKKWLIPRTAVDALLNPEPAPVDESPKFTSPRAKRIAQQYRKTAS
ncbi:helix-turn-helix domain-containing protein [uncultured Aeromicrobium sp.]|uniref:helix-turn-helix domain-containing protein n=1 Tax=uncultured Aeromicrobium sp. TaxID=337820 RepID=UPI0025D43D90|nr:helix-turn-helix domain-containing protein [uncultured Aeromicrobium sp.]